MSRYEANLNGEVEVGETYVNFKEVQVFKEILNKLGWRPALIDSKNGGYYLFEVSNDLGRIKLHLYLKRLTFGGRENREYEKRAQFSAALDRTGFNVVETENEFSLILGLYKREEYDDTVICAWNIRDWGYNEGNAFNCFVDIRSVAIAIKEGFAQHETSKGQIVCCFKPEWFLYYLENKDVLHGQIVPKEILINKEDVPLSDKDVDDIEETPSYVSDLFSFAGKGNRKPQLDVPYKLIHLDVENPRLAPYLIDVASPSPADLLSIIYDNFDTEVIALSMAANGYFDEEPIIVVPSKIPIGFKFSDYTDVKLLAEKLQQLINEKEIEFTVVEGNRRISTINFLLDDKIRQQIITYPGYPSVTDVDIKQDLSMVPCIIYERREDVSSYLGVRHIAGLLKWEAYAKAAYIAGVIAEEHQKGKRFDEAIQKVQQVYGDRSDSLKKQYIAYKIYLEAKDDLQFNVKPILNKFSLLIVLYNSPAIRDYIGISGHNNVDFEKRLIKPEKYVEFRNILTWIYGDEDKGIKPVLTDSRKITNNLSYIVQKDEAVVFLNKYKDLEGAFDRTNGEREYLSKNLTRAFRAIQVSLSFAYKYKGDEEILKQVTELEELIAALKDNLQK